MTVPPLGFTSYELSGLAHVKLKVHSQVAYYGLQPFGLGVGFILDKAEPIIIDNVTRRYWTDSCWLRVRLIATANVFMVVLEVNTETKRRS